MKVLVEQIAPRLEVLEDAAGGERGFRIRGTALMGGGVSRNGRYYPPEGVAAAAGKTPLPITLYARHRDAVEGTGLPVGRVDRLYLDGPALKYEATLAPTRLGRDLRALIEGGFIAGASIRAYPYASHRARLGDRDVEWIDALTLRGIDFTDDPGVPEAAGFEILEAAATGALLPNAQAATMLPEEERMNLEALDLETLRARRHDLVDAARAEARALLEETCRVLGLAGPERLPEVVAELARLRNHREMAALADAELEGDPLRDVIKARLLEECPTLESARERLQRERTYAARLRQAVLASGLVGAGGRAPAGAGLVENPEGAAVSPDQVRIRRLAGVAVEG